MYLRAAGIPESMINIVRRSYLTNMIYVYVNVFYYTEDPTHQAAYHAVRSDRRTPSRP